MNISAVFYRFFISAAILFAGLAVVLWTAGEALLKPGGLLWHQLHSPSLQYLQVLTERHLGLERLWQNWLQGGLLQLPALHGLLLLAGICLLTGLLFRLPGRRRKRRRFRSQSF